MIPFNNVPNDQKWTRDNVNNQCGAPMNQIIEWILIQEIYTYDSNGPFINIFMLLNVLTVPRMMLSNHACFSNVGRTQKTLLSEWLSFLFYFGICY